MLQKRIRDDDIAHLHIRVHATRDAGEHDRIRVEHMDERAGGRRGRDLADARERHDTAHAMRLADVILALAQRQRLYVTGCAHPGDQIAEFLRERRHDPKHRHSTGCSFATASASHFSPWRLKRTCARASPPEPSSAVTVPSPNFV